jgi:hypothetical protein
MMSGGGGGMRSNFGIGSSRGGGLDCSHIMLAASAIRNRTVHIALPVTMARTSRRRAADLSSGAR